MHAHNNTLKTIKTVIGSCVLLFTYLWVSIATAETTTNVYLETSLGVIEIELRPDAAPGHVENFLNYVNDGDFDKSFVHRSVSGFIIQGGGFNYIDQTFGFVPTDPPIQNEFGLSNTRGTVAMAKAGSDPNSATSQWFINLADNSANLDLQNGGFTVFGVVVKGMDVADAIAALPIINTGSAIGAELPVRNTPIEEPVEWENHLVLINQATENSFSVPILPPLGVVLLLIILAGIKRIDYFVGR
jgi:peptidyl-prolyl cis-trans isomerase A (cyclophilin A)